MTFTCNYLKKDDCSCLSNHFWMEPTWTFLHFFTFHRRRGSLEHFHGGGKVVPSDWSPIENGFLSGCRHWQSLDLMSPRIVHERMNYFMMKWILNINTLTYETIMMLWWVDSVNMLIGERLILLFFYFLCKCPYAYISNVLMKNVVCVTVMMITHCQLYLKKLEN